MSGSGFRVVPDFLFRVALLELWLERKPRGLELESAE